MLLEQVPPPPARPLALAHVPGGVAGLHQRLLAPALEHNSAAVR